MTDRRERRKQQTRQAIVDAASELFASKGFRGTTIAEIADRADVAQRTIFLHFASKEELLFWHLDDFADQAISDVASGQELGQALVQAVRSMVARYPDISRLAAERAELVGLPPMGAGLGTPHRLPQTLINKLWSAEQRILEQAKESFPDAYDPVLTPALLGALFGALVAGVTGAIGEQLSPRQARRKMNQIIDRTAAGFLD